MERTRSSGVECGASKKVIAGMGRNKGSAAPSTTTCTDAKAPTGVRASGALKVSATPPAPPPVNVMSKERRNKVALVTVADVATEKGGTSAAQGASAAEMTLVDAPASMSAVTQGAPPGALAVAGELNARAKEPASGAPPANAAGSASVILTTCGCDASASCAALLKMEEFPAPTMRTPTEKE